MRIAIVSNVVTDSVRGRPEDLASDREMLLIPNLVRDELQRSGHATTVIPADFALASACREFGADLALNLAEGFAGTNAHEHIVPSLLEYARIPYTGADATVMLVLRDKLLTKQVLSAYGVRSAPHHLLDDGDIYLPPRLRFPVILKPLREEASHGILYDSVVTTDEQLVRRVIELRRHYGRAVLAEEYIHGREVSVGVWGNDNPKALPPCEFMFRAADPLRRFRSFEAKWLEGQELMVLADKLPTAVLTEMRRIAILAHRVFRCRDYSRADFRVGDSGHVYFIEHNYNPGIGPNTHGLSNTFTRMAEFAGLSFRKMLAELLTIAAARYGH